MLIVVQSNRCGIETERPLFLPVNQSGSSARFILKPTPCILKDCSVTLHFKAADGLPLLSSFLVMQRGTSFLECRGLLRPPPGDVPSIRLTPMRKLSWL